MPILRTFLTFATVLGSLLCGPGIAGAVTMDASTMQSHGRYLGTPDLALTSAMLSAGGGAHFHAATLLTMLTAQHHDAETASLQARFGAATTAAFFRTFDGFIHDAALQAARSHVTFPRPDPALSHNSYELAASLRQAGIMPDGRFDVGYFLEHLLSRPMHVRLMHDADANPAIGPRANASFHIILTAAMNDLRTLYHLPA